MLLILTSDSDFTADYLIIELIERGLPYFRLNSEELAEASFTFSITGSITQRLISVGPRIVDLSQVQSVWYRRSIHPVPKATLTPAERYFVSGELRHLAMGLLLNPKILWMNPIDRVSVAEHKIFQLQIAASIGFRVPRSLVSSDLNNLRKFASESSGNTICKPIFHGLFFDGYSSYSVYTRRLDLETLDAASIEACPVFLQEEIPRIADLRVTIIGDYCFAAEIRGGEAMIDWRDPSNTIDYAAVTLDGITASRCQQMMVQLGLVYGAFDFIRLPSGELVFLEVNPTGEWAWLEDKLGFPMRDAFIKTLFREPN